MNLQRSEIVFSSESPIPKNVGTNLNGLGQDFLQHQINLIHQEHLEEGYDEDCEQTHQQNHPF